MYHRNTAACILGGATRLDVGRTLWSVKRLYVSRGESLHIGDGSRLTSRDQSSIYTSNLNVRDSGETFDTFWRLRLSPHGLGSRPQISGKPPGRFRAGERGRDSLEDRNTEGKRTATMYFIDVVVMLLQPTLYIFFAALSLAQFQVRMKPPWRKQAHPRGPSVSVQMRPQDWVSSGRPCSQPRPLSTNMPRFPSPWSPPPRFCTATLCTTSR